MGHALGRLALLVAAIVSSGCSDESTSNVAGGTAATGGDAGGCVPGQLALPDGSCRAPGVAVDGCGAGFVTDNSGGCVAVLPADPCAPGQLAVPGDTQCHPLADCGTDRWGAIPVDSTTQYVDASYALADSDGTAQKPWTTIGAALAAASSNDLVAVAVGTYAEDVTISSTSVRLWGRCPELVRIEGIGLSPAAILIQGADGTELHAVAVTGPGVGIGVEGSADVLFDRLLVQDTGEQGIVLGDSLGVTAARVEGSLVEGAHIHGIYARAADLEIKASSVRNTATDSTGALGRGIEADASAVGRARLTLSGSLIEHNPQIGIAAFGADAAIDAVDVRDLVENTTGLSVAIFVSNQDQERSQTTIHGSVLERNIALGLLVAGADATFESSVVRDTTSAEKGRGIEVRDDPASGRRGSVDVKNALLERCTEYGVFADGGDATVESVLVRNIAALADQPGRAIGSQVSTDTGQTSTATVRASRLEGVQGIGLVVSGSSVLVENCLITSMVPLSDGSFGRGIVVQYPPGVRAPTTATLRTTLIEDCYETGVFVFDGDATLEGMIIRGTKPNPASATFGDGVVVVQTDVASVQISASEISGNARAGVANFGASVSLGTTSLQCNAIQLDSEVSSGGIAGAFKDEGGNTCSCGTSSAPCAVLTSNLEAPQPLGP